jgi:hypothetical protein
MYKTISDTKSASPMPTDAEWSMMREALRRDAHCLFPMSSLHGTKVAKSGEKLIGLGLARQVKAKSSYPVWRRDAETGAAFALKLTTAGAKAAAADVACSDAEAAAGDVELRDPEKQAVSSRVRRAPSEPAELGLRRRRRRGSRR